jgi:hypothetical protein
MNKNILGLLAALALTASAPAWSIPIGAVGSADTLLASTDLGNSGEGTEASWISGVLGFAVSFADKTECEVGCSWEAVTGGGAGLYALELIDTPNYFLVKTGNGSSTGDTHFLFQNVASLDYAVFSLAQLGFGSRITISKVSHVSEFGSTPVPEPATVGLLGLGVLGLAFGKRRRARG